MIAKLIAESGTATGAILSLEEGEEWIVGRDPDEATLVVEDPRASRQHLLCRRTEKGIEVENLSQTNPALLNDAEFDEPRLLQEGDHLLIGGTLFRFTTADEPAKPPPEEEPHYETIFEAPATPAATPEIHLEGRERWLIKVVAGPNTGAEVRLTTGRTYLLGTDAATCDIVFHDLSVSRQHARLTVSDDEEVTIEDLHSRNGVVVEGKPITEVHPLSGNAVVALGTTSFLLVDREAAQETVVALTPVEKVEEEPISKEKMEPVTPVAPPPEPEKKHILTGGPFIMLLVSAVIVVVVVAAVISLFTSHEIELPPRNYSQQIEAAVVTFPDIRYSFNEATGRLFILGHVMTAVEKSELAYNINNLPFVKAIDDNVVVDQYVWEEMNAILAKNPDWTGVSMHAPQAGQFVLAGYLRTAKQASALQDYIHLNFTYLDRLDNQVVVEELLMADVKARLQSRGFAGVTPGWVAGELTLTGYVGKDELDQFKRLVGKLRQMPGVRDVKNFTVIIDEDRSLVDLSDKFEVQGFSKQDSVTINVLVGGQIVSRGDSFEGMQVISITPKMIILEKEGIKYKIDYNQQ